MINDGSAIFKGQKSGLLIPRTSKRPSGFQPPRFRRQKMEPQPWKTLRLLLRNGQGLPGPLLHWILEVAKKNPFPAWSAQGSSPSCTVPSPAKSTLSRTVSPVPPLRDCRETRARSHWQNIGQLKTRGITDPVLLDSPAFTGRQYPGHSGLSSWRPSGAPDSGEAESGFYGLV